MNNKHPLIKSKKSKVMLMVAFAILACLIAVIATGCANVPANTTTEEFFKVPEGPAEEGFGLNGETPTALSYFKYQEIHDGTMVITGVYAEAADLEKIVIPAVIDGKKVSRLYDSALATLGNLKEVVVSGYVVEICPYAFRDCKRLTKVTLSEHTVKLGEGAFQGCKSLKDISFIPASVRIIGDRVFEGCESLESVTIPDTIKSIGAYTFLNCTSLAEVKFPAGITAIPDRMFQGCKGLNNTIGDKDFVLPETVKSIGEFAFMNAKFRTFVFNTSVETIAQGAFAECPRLRDVKIPDSVKSIGNSNFAGCEMLDKVKLPMNDSLELGKTLFEGSKKLVEITVKAGTKAEKYCNDWKAQIEVLNADIEKDANKYRALTIVTQ